MWLAEQSHWLRAAGWLAERWWVPAASSLCRRSRARHMPAMCTDTVNTSAFKVERSSPWNKKWSRRVTQMAHALHNSCHFSSSSLWRGTEVSGHYPLRFTHISLFFLNKDWEGKRTRNSKFGYFKYSIFWRRGYHRQHPLYQHNSSKKSSGWKTLISSWSLFWGQKRTKQKKIWKIRKNVMPGWATKGFIFTAYLISLHVAFHWAQPLLAATR